jgi:hypothetical protein
VPRGGCESVSEVMRTRGWSEVVVKPAVSASSRGTMRVHPDAIDAGDAHLRAVVTNGDALVQPYFRSVEDYGERAIIAVPWRGSRKATSCARLADPAATVGWRPS